MRVLLLLKSGRHYVLSAPIHDLGDSGWHTGPLATGGRVIVHIDNIESVEEYQDHQIEQFRFRLRQLESGGSVPPFVAN